MPATNREIKGFFISFTEKEISDVREELLARGYESGGEGIKEFLMDSLFEEEPEEVKKNFDEKISDLLKSHPEMVALGRTALMNLLKKAAIRI
jgi:hypothetical protein